jgi:tetratricopeptide (TPR) repeat protein
MYKKRIKEWKIMKNYKREEKDAVSHALQRRTQAGKVSHQVMIRNQPVKFQRILRHLKASAGTTISCGSTSPWSCSKGSEIEVRTPDAESIVLDESTHRNFQADLLRGLSPGPGRPIFTRGDLGIAEILCWESVGYFESALSVHARTLSRPDHMASLFHLANSVSAASSLAESRRYSDARVTLNNTLDELKNALMHQSPSLLPSLLSIIYTGQEDQTPFKVRELYREHAVDLCSVYLGVRHPITVIMRSFPKASDKTQVFNAVLRSLLAVVLKKAGFGEAHDLPIYLMQLQYETLERLGQFEEGEKILRRALTISTTANGTGHWRTLDILLDLASLNKTSLWNRRHAKVLVDTVLRDTVDEEGVVIHPIIRLKALSLLAYFARVDGDLPKAEDLLQQALEINAKRFGPKHWVTVYMADFLEGVLREQGKHLEANRLTCLYQLEDEFSLRHSHI